MDGVNIAEWIKADIQTDYQISEYLERVKERARGMFDLKIPRQLVLRLQALNAPQSCDKLRKNISDKEISY